MHSKPFQVIFTGKYMPGTDKGAVVSNLVLMGISEEKARALVRMQRAVLKRFTLPGDAQKMVAKLEKAGLVCVIEESLPDAAEASTGESMLVSIFSRFSRKSP